MKKNYAIIMTANSNESIVIKFNYHIIDELIIFTAKQRLITAENIQKDV